jgi:hypothetical protein
MTNWREMARAIEDQSFRLSLALTESNCRTWLESAVPELSDGISRQDLQVFWSFYDADCRARWEALIEVN